MGDIEIRKALACDVCNKTMKMSLYTTKSPEDTFICNNRRSHISTWNLTKSQSKGIDGCYTITLRMALNMHWGNHTRDFGS